MTVRCSLPPTRKSLNAFRSAKGIGRDTERPVTDSTVPYVVQVRDLSEAAARRSTARSTSARPTPGTGGVWLRRVCLR